MSVALSSITDNNALWDNSGEQGTEEAVAPTLYGRAEDEEVLLQSFQKVRTTHASQVVCVHGISGSGKSTLIERTLRGKVCAEGRGYFCAGKFFQNSGTQGEPFSAIMTDFSDLCDLVVQSDHFNETSCGKIRKDLLIRPEAAAILGRMINLTPFLGQTLTDQLSTSVDSTAKMGTDVAFAKFKSACKTFLQSMASECDHPVVLFIDDIQWMDEGSRHLIEMLIKDEDLSNFLLILAYRDEEADNVGGLLTSAIIDIQLSNLEQASVHEMVCTTLGSASSIQFRDLSDLVLLKTHGNPFFVVQFMDTIIRENMMRRNENGEWEFDAREIKQEIMISNTVADLLYRRIELLSRNMKATLMVASIIGYCFEESTLLQVAYDTYKQREANLDFKKSFIALPTAGTIEVCLAEAVKAGFIERLDQDSYQFSHDKLQMAFNSLVCKAEEECLHFLIGEIFLARGNADASTIYNAAVHLNAAPGFIITNNQRAGLTRTNLKAARYCKTIFAFDKASELLRTGLGLLNSRTKWLADLFDLTFEMTEELARMELAAGRFNVCKDIVEEVLRRGKSTEMKINALLLGVECRMASNDFDGSILEARRALQTLDVKKIPRRISIRHVIPKLLSVKRKMASKTDDDILGLPIVQDRAVTTAVRLLSHVCIYSLLKDDENEAIYTALLAMELTLQYGLSPDSSTALTMFGISELSFGNYDRAYRYGKLAINLMKQTNSGDAECPTVGLATTFLLHWKEPLSELRDPIYLAATNGLERGDFVYGTFCFWQSCYMGILLGQSFGSSGARMYAEYRRRGYALGGQSVLHKWLQPNMQLVANMQSDSTNWEQLTHLTGEYMQEEEYIREAEEANITILSFAVRWSGAQLACCFGMYGLAETKYKELISMGKAAHLAFSSVSWFWYAAIIHYEQYRALGRRASLRRARSCKRKLERMAANGCPNVSEALIYLGLKELTLRVRMGEADWTIGLDSAIEALTGTVYFEAMANEDAGFTFARLGKREQARKYLRRAMHIYYHEWGAIAKYYWLEEKCADILDRLDETGLSCAALVGGVLSFQEKRAPNTPGV